VPWTDLAPRRRCSIGRCLCFESSLDYQPPTVVVEYNEATLKRPRTLALSGATTDTRDRPYSCNFWPIGRIGLSVSGAPRWWCHSNSRSITGYCRSGPACRPEAPSAIVNGPQEGLDRHCHPHLGPGKQTSRLAAPCFPRNAEGCPLLVVNQTCLGVRAMSPYDPKLKSCDFSARTIPGANRTPRLRVQSVT
jgi:hypothetical protein